MGAVTNPAQKCTRQKRRRKPTREAASSEEDIVTKSTS
jgi:hypothetical protein